MATTPAAPFNSASLYIGDLAPEVTEALLFEKFNHVGPVASVRVCRDAQSRRSLGYAYINFHRIEDAERALDSLNFAKIRDRPCRIMWSHRDPTLRKSGQGNIFISGLSKTIDNKSLYDTFSMFGNILSCKVATDSDGNSLGYGFVHYDDRNNAQTAIDRVHKKVIAGGQVNVEFFKPKLERFETPMKFTNIFVKHIPEDWTEDRFLEIFAKYGTIKSGKLAVDDEGKSRGFGFVDYTDHSEAQKAIEEMNNTDHNGHELYVGRAQKRRERQEQLKQRYFQIKNQRAGEFQTGGNLYVKHLSDEMDEKRLKEMFEKIGPVSSVRIVKDSTSQKSRGFGFVCFKRPQDADIAIRDLNGSFIDNKPLYVGLAQKSGDRKLELEQQFNARNKMAMGMAPPQPINFGGGIPQPVQMPMYPGFPAAYPYAGYGVAPPQPYAAYPQIVRPYAPVQMMRQPAAAYQMPHPAMMPNMPRRIAQRQQVQFAQPPVMPVPMRQQPQRQMNHAQQQQPYAVAQQAPRQAAGQGAPADDGKLLTMEGLRGKSDDEKKQLLGEQLFKQIKPIDAQQAGKITGMLLEMSTEELVSLIHNRDQLELKVQEAQNVLTEHQISEMENRQGQSKEE